VRPMAELVLLHTADLHGKLSRGAAARLRLMKAELGALLLDSGDALSVPNIIAVPWRTAAARRMAEAGYDAMALGNREYFFRARGISWVARSFPFPLLAANLDLPPAAGVERVAYLDHASGEVAVLGLARCMIPPTSFLQRLSNVRWRDPVETVRDIVGLARPRSQWFVALSHLGLRDDLKLACQCPELDVVLGAHDHLLTAVAATSAGPTVVHSGCHARSVSIIRLRRRKACHSEELRKVPSEGVDVTVEVVRL